MLKMKEVAFGPPDLYKAYFGVFRIAVGLLREFKANKQSFEFHAVYVGRLDI